MRTTREYAEDLCEEIWNLTGNVATGAVDRIEEALNNAERRGMTKAIVILNCSNFSKTLMLCHMMLMSLENKLTAI